MTADDRDPAGFLAGAVEAGAVTEMTTGSAMSLLRAGGIPTTRHSARSALRQLTAEGLLAVTERPGRRAYTPRETT